MFIHFFLAKRKWSYCEVMKNEVTSDIYKWWKNTLWWNFLYHIFENDIDWSNCYQGIKIQFPFTPKTENIEKTFSTPRVFQDCTSFFMNWQLCELLQHSTVLKCMMSILILQNARNRISYINFQRPKKTLSRRPKCHIIHIS